MSEDTPIYHAEGDAALEARIVALVLGEASPFEAGELERLCAERPELEIFRRRISAIHQLLGQAEKPARNASWRLSAEKRSALDEVIGAPAAPAPTLISARKHSRVRRLWVPAAACALLLVAIGGLVAPMTMRQSKSALVTYAAQEARMKLLETEFPPELIEGTPVPITPERLMASRRPQAPGSAYAEVAGSPPPPPPASAPATRASERRAEVTAANSAAFTQIPVPAELGQEPSIAFGGPADFGAGWGDGPTATGELQESGGFLLGSADQAPKPAPASSQARIVSGDPDAAIALAREHRKVGQFAEARELIEPLANVNERARNVDAIDQPIRTNAALTHEHTRNVDAVRRGLYIAEGNYNLGKFDDAKREYENVLRTDPHNAAARRGMERLAASQSDSFRAAYDVTRSELLAQVDQAWELSIPADAAPEDVNALRELAETVEERRKTLATIVRTKGIAYAGEHTGARTALPSYHQLEQVKLQIENQIESLIRYDNDQLLTYAAGLNLPDNTVRELVPKYLELQSQAAKMQSEGTDGRSREVAEVQEKLDGLRNQMDEGVLNLRATLRAQLDLTSDRLDRVETMRDETRDQAIQRGLDAQDFVEAKAAYEADLRRLEEMQARLSETTETPDPLTELTLPELIARIDALRKAIEEPSISDSRKQFQFEELRRLNQLAIKKSKATPPPPVPENETSAAADPFSTFSLNVSDASFVLARDALRRGERPAPEQIQVEQFYNAFDYGDPAPSPGEAVATRIEQSAHPLLPGRNLVRIAARVGGAGRAASQPLHLTLLVDQSGSMVRADRRAALDIALQTLAGLLNENDRVNLIGFARGPRLIAEAMPGTRAAELPRLVHIAAAEGGTNLEAALELAGEITARNLNPAAQNRIVILSDGAANLGDADPARLADRITRMRQQGIATDIAGIGSDGINDALLAELARHGDGRFHIVTPETGESLARDLAGAFRPAARDVKVQVVFNPERVGGWRLVGFEQHRLRTEDFRNDAVDAAELAENEAATAIYQVEILNDGRGEIGEFFIRFLDPATGRAVERSWPVPYQPNAPAADQAAPSMQLATLAMLTAEQLRGGPLAAATTPETTRPLIQAVTTHYRDNPRARELLEIQSLLDPR